MGLGAGTGFAGLAVALLGRSSALGLVLAALFFGTLQQGGSPSTRTFRGR